MAVSVFHLLVILLGFSHLLSLNAVSVARTRSLLSDPHRVPIDLENSYQGITEETWDEELINGRIDMEKMDYPGSGANNHHNPHPPPAEKQN